MGDALGEAGECVLARWVSIRIWRFRVENTDSINEADAGLGDLGSRTLTEFVFVGDDQVDVDEFHAVVVLAAAVSRASANMSVPGCRGRELVDALALRSHSQAAGHSRAARRDGRLNQKQSHPPVPLGSFEAFNNP